MNDPSDFRPQHFAVVGAGPVGCIVAAFLARSGFDVTLCDVVPRLIEPARSPGIRIAGIETFRQTVSKTLTNIDKLAQDPPDVIFITVKATALPLIASALQGFCKEDTYVVSWQNGIDTELVLARSLGRRAVMRAVVNYGCNLIEPGHVHMAFHHPPHFIQELDPVSRPVAFAIAQILTQSGLATNHIA